MNDVLVDGWTIYLWMVAGVAIFIAAVFGIRWAMRNEQFDEDIKYVMFTEDDEEKMDPEEYAKSREVISQQIQRREEVLKERAERNEAAHR